MISRPRPWPVRRSRPLRLGPLLCLPLLAGMGVRAADIAIPASPEGSDLTTKGDKRNDSISHPAVESASKHEQPISEAPSDVSIVTKDDIKQYGYKTLADILDSVRGLYVTFDRGYHFVGIRGVNRPGDFGGRLLLNVNGHRFNNPLYDATLIGNDFELDVDLIERVEVVRGPSAALYGNNAFFGVINVVTRKGRDIGGHGFEASASYGSFDSFSGRVSYGRQFTNGVELMLSGTWYESAGNPEIYYPEFSAENGGVIKNHDAEYARNIFASISYSGFTLEGLYGRREKELPNAPYAAVFSDKRNELWDERAYAELRYEREFEDDGRLKARAYFDHYAYEGTFAYDYMDPLNPDLTVNRDTPWANWTGVELQGSRTFWERHRFTAGLEGRYDLELHQENFDVAPPATYIDQTSTTYSLGVYAQDEFRIHRTLLLNAGVRYDYYDTFGSTVNPRAGLIYQPWAASTFKALYGQAFRAPNGYEFDYESADYKGNHDLSPETIRSYELVWQQDLGKHWRFTSSLFYNQIDDLITQGVDSGDGRLVFRNTDSVNVKGAEAEVEARWGRGFRGRLGYTFADAREDGGGHLDNSPQHVGKFQITVPIFKEKLSAGFELLALSSRRTVQGNQLDGQVIGNLTLLSREIVKNLEFSASIYNLFDTHYRDPASPDFTQDANPRDGRTFRVKLGYKF